MKIFEIKQKSAGEILDAMTEDLKPVIGKSVSVSPVSDSNLPNLELEIEDASFYTYSDDRDDLKYEIRSVLSGTRDFFFIRFMIKFKDFPKSDNDIIMAETDYDFNTAVFKAVIKYSNFPLNFKRALMKADKEYDEEFDSDGDYNSDFIEFYLKEYDYVTG